MTSDVSGSWFELPADASAEGSDAWGSSSRSARAKASLPLTGRIGNLPPARIEPLSAEQRDEIDAWRDQRHQSQPSLDIWSRVKDSLERS